LAKTGKTIKIPPNEIATINTIKKSVAALEQTLSRSPSPEEIAEHIDLPIGELSDPRLYGMSFSSLDKPIGEDGDTNFSDMLVSDTNDTDHSVAYLESLRIELTSALEALTPREREVIEMRY
jgi:RNA polymerase primary sigma factor